SLAKAEHSVGNVRTARTPFRDISRDEIDRAADRIRSVGYRGRSLEDLDSSHARDQREIISGRCGIGSGGKEHSVFHERDLSASLGVGTADTNVRSQPKSIFLPDLYARHAKQNLVRITLLILVELLLGES